MTQVQIFEGTHSFVEAGSLRETMSLSLGLENDDYTLKRELKVHKRSGVEFGISLCRLNGELFITDVLDFSPAWRCGLRTGDRIERIDNLLLRTDAFHRVILNPGAVLDHLRKAQDLKLKVADCPLVRYHVLKKYTEPELHSSSGAKSGSLSQLPNVKEPPTFGLVYSHCHVQDVQVGSDAKAAGFRVGDSIVEINGQVTIGLTDDVIMNHIHMLRQKTEVTVCTMPAVLAAELDLARIVAGKKPPRILLKKDEKKPPHPFKGFRLSLLGKKKKEYTTTSAAAKQSAPPPLHSGSLVDSDMSMSQAEPHRPPRRFSDSSFRSGAEMWRLEDLTAPQYSQNLARPQRSTSLAHIYERN